MRTSCQHQRRPFEFASGAQRNGPLFAVKRDGAIWLFHDNAWKQVSKEEVQDAVTARGNLYILRPDGTVVYVAKS